jgi:hypothetical protein
MILKIFRGYQIAKTIYTKVLKPIYLELRKDAYAEDDKTVVRRKKVVKKKTSKN